MPRPRKIVLRRPEEVRTVAGLVAHRIISIMERTRASTVAELAEHTGMEAGSLYYHVRKLKRIGVLRERERRGTGGREMVVYELAGSEVVLDPKASSPAFLRELGASIRTRLRSVERGLLAALGRAGTVRSGPGRNLSVHFHHVRLKPSDLTELQRRIAALEEFLVEADDPTRKDFVNITVAVHPLERGSA